jgi:hypothetical protein
MDQVPSTEFHQKLRKFHQKYGRLDKEGFKAIFRKPILAFDLRGISATPRDLDKYAQSSAADGGTVLEESPDARVLGIHVAPLAKSDRNEIAGKITLGRASECDVVIPHPSISKVHAWFVFDQEARCYAICDGGSRYGTVVCQQKIEPHAATPLKSKDTINLAGSIAATFFSPGDFFDYMQIMTTGLK